MEMAELESQLPTREQLKNFTFQPITFNSVRVIAHMKAHLANQGGTALMTLEFVHIAATIRAQQYQVGPCN